MNPSDRPRSAELAALTAIAAQVNCTQDLDEILSAALRTTLEVIGESTGEIFLIDEESGALILYTHQGLSDAFIRDEARVGPDECICGQAIRAQKPITVIDLETYPSRSRQACLREGFQSCIRLPLLARGQVLGLLNIQSRNHREFTEADQELLVAIGHQIGIAIANAQLIKDAERRRATLDSVMNSLVDGLILFDRRGQIVYVNPCAAEVLGLPALTLLGQDLEAIERRLAGQVIQPTQVFAQLQAAAADPKGKQAVEISLTSPPHTLQARFFSVDDRGGGQLGLGLILRDITREKELDQMKSQLLSIVSHELRTPLASIKGFATTLLREDVEWDEASRREFLTIIDQESDRLSELIGNLLDMSRIEAGTLRVEPERIDLRPIIQETAAAFQRMTSLPIVLQIPPALPMLLADPRRIRQVLRNLIENAIKYSPDGGTITISVTSTADHLWVSVSDQGIGIEPEKLPNIFGRFYQIDTSPTRRVGGIGLGLSICKAIVEAHHGQIWAESQPGVGSTFHFTLPLLPSLPSSAAE